MRYLWASLAHFFGFIKTGVTIHVPCDFPPIRFKLIGRDETHKQTIQPGDSIEVTTDYGLVRVELSFPKKINVKDYWVSDSDNAPEM
jgi:hypothetical protein